MPRDWNAERKELASALTQLEITKLWLMEHQQSAPELSKELERINARLGKFGEIDEEGMKQFQIGIDRERWKQFTEACNIQAGQEIPQAAVETRAFYLWSDAIDAIIEHYKAKKSAEPVVLTIWA